MVNVERLEDVGDVGDVGEVFAGFGVGCADGGGGYEFFR